jgi:predicted ATP-dependent endonuclease of OLD family
VIERVRVLGYRKFRELNFEPHQRLNILVGDNDAGKSTLLEAITLALTGRVSGRLASDEVNPFWFNAEMVKEFFAGRSTGETPAPPAIEIEVFLHDHDDFQRNLFGANNSEQPTREHLDVPLYWQCWKLDSPLVKKVTDAVSAAAAALSTRKLLGHRPRSSGR